MQLDSSQSSMKHLSGWRMGLSVQFLTGLLSWIVLGGVPPHNILYGNDQWCQVVWHSHSLLAQVKHSYCSEMLLYFSHSQRRSIEKASLGGWRMEFSSASCGTADSRSVGDVLRARVNLVWIVSGAGPLGGQPHRGSASGASQATCWSWKEADAILCCGELEMGKKSNII